MTRTPIVNTSSLAVKTEIQNATYTYAADAGASDAYAITLSPAPSAYADGQRFSFKANTANTGAASLDVNSLGAKTIKKLSDQDLATGDIEVGQIVEVAYNATDDTFEMQSQVAQVAAGGQTLYTAVVASSGGDYTTLGAAIAAASNGWTIFIRPGTYTESAITTTLTDLTIIGAGKDAVTLACSTNTLDFSGVRTTIRDCGFTFTTKGLHNRGANSILLNCKITRTSSQSVPILKMNGAYSLIYGNYVSDASTTDNSERNIWLNGGGSRIEANHFYYHPGNQYSCDVSNAICVGNLFETDSSSATNQGYYLIATGGNGTFSGNRIQGFTMRKIALDCGSGAEVMGNYFEIAGSGSIPISVQSRSTVIGNYIYPNGNKCIDIEGSQNTIQGNTCLTTGTAIYVNGSQCTISGNIIVHDSGTTVGIDIRSGISDTVASNNTFIGLGADITDSGTDSQIISNSTNDDTQVFNKLGGPLALGVGNALTAAGSTRADALQLTKQINNITTAAASTGVILPVGIIGMRITVFNAGANPVQVYASASETIDTVAGSTGVPLTNAKRCDYFYVAANTWISAQLGVVSA